MVLSNYRDIFRQYNYLCWVITYRETPHACCLTLNNTNFCNLIHEDVYCLLWTDYGDEYLLLIKKTFLCEVYVSTTDVHYHNQLRVSSKHVLATSVILFMKVFTAYSELTFVMNICCWWSRFPLLFEVYVSTTDVHYHNQLQTFSWKIITV